MIRISKTIISFPISHELKTKLKWIALEEGMDNLDELMNLFVEVYCDLKTTQEIKDNHLVETLTRLPRDE